jgi:cytochrome c oxidase assembly protein subunit 15
MNSLQKKQVTIWLYFIIFLVFAMVVVGGVTRLTHSGLSIVEWKPLMGAIPPLNQEAWEEVFEKYKQFPEYKIHNRHMSLSDFKFIFFWEYFHRLLGRTIGLAYLIPFLFFYFKKYFDKKLTIRLLIGFLLGGLQGGMGWFMVKSGLVDNPAVSHYRLAAHLSIAFAIAGYLFWIILEILGDKSSEKKSDKKSDEKPHRRFNLSLYITAGICLQIIYGAFVAGKKAGLGFNTFPKMDDSWIPDEVFSIEPAWLNFFETNAAIQFAHRVIAWILVIAIPFVLIKFKNEFNTVIQKRARHLLLSTLGVQFILGVLTILYIGESKVVLPTIHQAGAFVLFIFSVYFNFALYKNE